ncbi:MAG: enoyl-CoA hydratase-related protein [Rudaea sp.]|uniref:enoyl-CoA hydratase-related protein n=1 Tax=Rudaea sp. TaxID=2136325 RepID=UPI0039E5988C
MDELIRTRLDEQGVLLAAIDMPGRRMNVFSADLIDAFDALLDRVEGDAAVRCVVLTSAKSTFLAGADLVMVAGFSDSARVLDEAGMVKLCGRLGRVFVRLEDSAKPWVAAVNGIALGGGLELAMACRERIVADDPRIQIGLPEVRWGLLPGAGGTQRLPRLAGFRQGLELLLTGRSLAPQEAVALGVFAQAVPTGDLVESARSRALALCGRSYDLAAKFAHLAQADVPAHSAQQVRELARSFGIDDERFEHYPAHRAILNCVLLGARHDLAGASAIEMREFVQLMFDPVAGNMVRSLFINRQRADKELVAPAGVEISRLRHGALSDEWGRALGKSGLQVAPDAALPAGTIAIEDDAGATQEIRVADLRGAVADAQAVLSPAGEYGRALEIVGVGKGAVAVLAALAARLRALPWPTHGASSVLAALKTAATDRPTPATLDAQAVLALRLVDAGGIDEPVFLDVAACAASVSPAYTGGPLTWFVNHRARLLETLEPALKQAWVRIAPKLGVGPA